MPKSEIMTIEEVARYLRVSERTVYDWAQKGEVPCGRLGASWRFKRSEIERWTDEKLGVHRRKADTYEVSIETLLAPERVVISNLTHKKEALDLLIDILAQAAEIRDRDELAEEVYRREALMSTGIGGGIAVPHVRLDSIRDIVASAGVFVDGISDYESFDGQPVRIVLMLAAARHQHAEYLKALSIISARLQDADLRRSLVEAKDPEAIHQLLLGHPA